MLGEGKGRFGTINGINESINCLGEMEVKRFYFFQPDPAVRTTTFVRKECGLTIRENLTLIYVSGQDIVNRFEKS